MLSYVAALPGKRRLEQGPAALALAVMATASAAALAHADWSKAADQAGTPGRAEPAASASPPPLLLREVAREDALAINRRIPLSADPNPAARPFRFKGDAATYARALECLASAVYYEAGNESLDGQRGVAQVVLNRVRHPAFSPSVCAVVYEGFSRRTGCQFSFTCDGSLQRRPNAAAWYRSAAVAKAALDGEVFAPVGYATHYHANYVVPYWATSLAKNQVIGAHIFYRWPTDWGRPGAFTRTYAAREQDPVWLRQAALSRRQYWQAMAPPEQRAPEADPRIELVRIVQFLAASSEPGDQEPADARAVRSYFAGHSDHLAVQVYRQLSGGGDQLSLETLAQIVMHYSPPPELQPVARLDPELVRVIGGEEKLAGLIASLRDFATYSDFDSYWRDRQSGSPEMVAQARESPAAPVRVEQASLEQEGPGTTAAPLMQSAAMVECEPSDDGPSRPGEIVVPDASSDTDAAPMVRC